MLRQVIIPKVVRELSLEKLRQALHDLCRELDASRANICFIEPDGLTNTPRELRLPHADQPILQLRVSDGITGLAIDQGRTFLWPQDEETRGRYKNADPEVCSELAGPLRYEAGIGGAVWIDRTRPQQEFDRADGDTFARALVGMNDFLNEAKAAIDSAPHRLDEILEQCLTETNSGRGYIAIKHHDGMLEYISRNEDQFLGLTQFEGLCGQVFETGAIVNVADVHSHPDYIPSHPDVRSELVVPIFAADEEVGRVIGLINMESESYDAYTRDHEFVLEARAKKAARHVILFRDQSEAEGPDFGKGLVEILLRSEHRDRPRVRTKTGQPDVESKQLCDYARSAFAAESVRWLPATRNPEEPPHPNATVTVTEHGEGVTMSGRVLVGGESVGQICVHWTDDRDRNMRTRSVRQLCHYAGRFSVNGRTRHRFADFIDLIDDLSAARGDETILQSCAERIPDLLDARHCTILHQASLFGKRILVPGPSSIDDFPIKGPVESYYEWDAEAGLTPWIAVTGRHLCIANVEDPDELARIDSRLTWAARIAEVINTRPRAFLGFPIKDDNERTIGVIRTFRDLTCRRSVFSDDDISILRSVARLVSDPLQAYIRRSQLVHAEMSETT